MQMNIIISFLSQMAVHMLFSVCAYVFVWCVYLRKFSDPLRNKQILWSESEKIEATPALSLLANELH